MKPACQTDPRGNLFCMDAEARFTMGLSNVLHAVKHSLPGSHLRPACWLYGNARVWIALSSYCFPTLPSTLPSGG